MTMYNRLPIIGGRSATILPVGELAASEAPDGPIAVLSAVFAAARRHKTKFALWMLFCVAAAAAYAYLATPYYTATATLLLEPRRQASQTAQDTLLSSGFDVSRAEGELQVLRSERLLANVFGSLHLADDPEFAAQPPDLLSTLRSTVTSAVERLLGLSPAAEPSRDEVRQMRFETFVSRVAVRRIGQSYVAEIAYTAHDPTLARRVANASASAYLWQSIAAKADAAKNGAEFLQGRLNGLSAQARAAAAAVAAGTLPEAPTPDADARVIGAALQPLKPSAPRKALVLALGAMVGLVSGFVGVALGQALDRRVRTAQAITQQVGLPCLATLPTIDGRRWSALRRNGATGFPAKITSTAFARGIRELRASVQLTELGRAGDVAVALVACAPGAGTSLIGYHLAGQIRDSGHHVTLIDCDLHGTAIWPPAGRGPHTADGLADLLHDDSRLDGIKLLDREGIAVIPARSADAAINRLAYLGASSLKDLIKHRRQTDTVILDLPSLATAAETRAAARRADAVVIVAQAGRTTVDDLIGAASGLRSVGANVIGVVLNQS